MSNIGENLARLEDSIAEACRKAGRPRKEVELMAVSKTHPVESLLEAVEAGHTLFGENRVQEFADKYERLSSLGHRVEHFAVGESAPSATPLRVALIGHLQSNKSARAAEVFSTVDTVDSLKLSERLDQSARSLQRRIPILLEVKLSSEPTKEGLQPDSDELASLLERLPDMAHLDVRGLMTIAPFDADPEVARQCFGSLRLLRDRLATSYPRLSLETLSMGMSGDYPIAIEEGSTQIRIGTAIFGARPKRA